MASISREARRLVIVNYVVFEVCAAMQQLNDCGVLHSTFVPLVAVFLESGDLRTGTSGLPRQIMYITDDRVRPGNIKDKDASCKPKLRYSHS